MPCVSSFYGIAIYLYYADHNPPHFHAVYSGQKAEIAISDGAVLAGALSRRAARLVEEWREQYREELLLNWKLAREGRKLQPIPSLV
jgi:hypothetical protein